MRCISLTFVFLFAAILPLWIPKAVAETPREKAEREADEAKFAQMQEKLRQKDGGIWFFGKVLDQSNQPVAEAEVALHIQKFSLSPVSLFSQTKKIHKVIKGSPISVSGQLQK